jgi:hypothetical protein
MVYPGDLFFNEINCVVQINSLPSGKSENMISTSMIYDFMKMEP